MTIEVHTFKYGDAVPGGASMAFDAVNGVHPSQVRIIASARQTGQDLGIPTAALSLEPHPRRLLYPKVAPFALLTRDQEIRELNRLGVDLLYILIFDVALSRLDHEQFSKHVLRGTLNVRHVTSATSVIYGRDRGGTQTTLRREAALYGFGLTLAPTELAANGATYTSAIRSLVSEGRMREAAVLFGRHFSIEGPVQHGAKLGRTIGFPTANIALGDYVRPAAGIYASVSLLEDGRLAPGVSYVGRRPTVDGGEARLEVHLFDFDAQIYGQQIETALIDFIRPDECFDSLEAMQTQMEADRKIGRKLANAALSSVVFAKRAV